jgi:hypothetical protein
MPMMATTIINSMSVKPFCIVLNIRSSLLKTRPNHSDFKATAWASSRDTASAVPAVRIALSY